MKITPEIEERLKLLDIKYAASGQDLVSYLDGLLYDNYLKYWDYIELDTLLTLQKPRTSFPDEEIFIIYHQITELYFKLVLKELRNLTKNKDLTETYFLERIKRVVRYFEALIGSFNVMVEGMDRTEFMKFRMSLLPASGFQSVQYRKIEMCCTSLKNLVEVSKREEFENSSDLLKQYQNIYWKQGAQDVKTGKKTLTLLEFEEEYDTELLKLAKKVENNTVYDLYHGFNKTVNLELKQALRKLDLSVNVDWPLAHYKSAVRYLHSQDGDVKATGGTNWQKYLPPRFQKRIFFPELWTNEEKENWGRVWVEESLKELKKD